MTSTPVHAAPARRGRGRPALGRETPLALEEILDRAFDIVQSEGLDELSMRRLAAELGVTATSIYRYVPDKTSLIHELIERVWDLIIQRLPAPTGNVIEDVIAAAISMRRVWIDHIELAPYAVAVAPLDERLFQAVTLATVSMEAAGFPDVPLAYNAIQTLVMGSVMIASGRRTSSAYFGRDPGEIRRKARRLLKDRDASDNELGVLEGRFDAGDELHFEQALRSLFAGLVG